MDEETGIGQAFADDSYRLQQAQRPNAYPAEYLEKQAAWSAAMRPPSLRDRLERELADHRGHTERIKKLLTLLDANPDTQEILELLNGRF